MRRIWGLAGVLVACGALWAQKEEPGEFPHRTPVVIAVEKAGPAIVNIATEKVMIMRGNPAIAPRGVPDQDWLEDFWKQFPQQHEVKARSLGSGVLIDRRGYIITNAHVVQRANKIQISLMDKTVYTGRLISLDAAMDLAVVKIDGKTDFPTVRLGDSSALSIGETVIAVGNPFGYAHTVTTGVLSAKDRSIDIGGGVSSKGLLQTDASINPGNSGGALLDINGRLIGICEAIRAQAEGIGFAIPVDTVKSAMVDLLDFRRINRTWLGLGLESVNSTATGKFAGLRVRELEQGGPADTAGLKMGDVLTKIDGTGLENVISFEILMLDKKAGEKTTFAVMRGRETMDVAVTVGKLPVPDATETIRRRTGMTVEVLDEAGAAKEGLAHGGLRVTGVSPAMPASDAGLTPGDVIQVFGNYRVTQIDDLGSLLGKLPTKSRVMVVIVRKGYNYYAWMTIR